MLNYFIIVIIIIIINIIVNILSKYIIVYLYIRYIYLKIFYLFFSSNNYDYSIISVLRFGAFYSNYNHF